MKLNYRLRFGMGALLNLRALRIQMRFVELSYGALSWMRLLLFGIGIGSGWKCFALPLQTMKLPSYLSQLPKDTIIFTISSNLAMEMRESIKAGTSQVMITR